MNLLEKKEKIVLAGHEFTLKPYTKRVVDELYAKQEEIAKKIENGEIDEWERDFEILKLISDGPFDEVDPHEIDGRAMELAILDFFPASKRSAILLLGFLNV